MDKKCGSGVERVVGVSRTTTWWWSTFRARVLVRNGFAASW
jgi:hypothetical protein